MTNLEKWKNYYDKGWASKDQLKIVVSLEGLTAEEYQTITGEEYPQ